MVIQVISIILEVPFRWKCHCVSTFCRAPNQGGLDRYARRLLVGPRQSGKTTLAQKLAGEDIVFLTLDNATTLDLARTDPVGFIRGLDRVIIDEIQRAPDLLLAIKESVDNDPRPGRFLLTGSSNLMTLPRVADSLAGRMETVRLLPLAQSEILGKKPSFFADVFTDGTPTASEAIVGDDLMELVLAGGYPEGLARSSPARRERWYLDYVDAILQRDLQDVAQIEQAQQMPRLLRVLAQHAGQLVNYSGIGAPLGMKSCHHTKVCQRFGKPLSDDEPSAVVHK